MLKAAVLGDPISHSLSPELHRFWLEQMQINGSYDAIECKRDDLRETLMRLEAQGYQGVNLTVPLKEAVLPHLEEISPAARQIGAVNVVIFENGKWLGDNTDKRGFSDNLHHFAPDYKQYLQHVVIIGAGGAARAVVAALLEDGAAHISITNRTAEKASALADTHRQIEWVDWQKRHSLISSATLLVNTTSLGMQNQPALDLKLTALPPKTLVTDIVYNPLRTDLLKRAANQDNTVILGLGMLIYQAIPSFAAFYGQTPVWNEAFYQTLSKRFL